MDENECRICFEEETEDNIFINPCLCKGTSKYVHINCLNQWRLNSNNPIARYQCSECKYNYIFTSLYPSDFHNKFYAGIMAISSGVYFTSVAIWMVVNMLLLHPKQETSIDSNILNSLYPNTTYYYSFKENIITNHLVLYYLIFYNTILYYQGLILYSGVFLYLLKNLNNKKRYIHHLGPRLTYYLFFPFKFKVFYILSVWGDISGYSLYITLMSLSLIESPTYLILKNIHNETIDKIEKNNVEYILNYEEDEEDEDDVVEVENEVYFDRINIRD
tara:strand:- start:7372 stop:8196 length:825 start_codon:yes stop_codon:yes gene_type:complete